MRSPATETSPQAAEGNTQSRRRTTSARPLTALAAAVGGRAQLLQRQSLDDRPGAVRRLAVLRRAVGTEPGSDAEVWQDTIDLVPDDRLGCGDDPSPGELAAHHAMTLFALHRQGKCERAHVDQVAPGAAFAQLARRRGRAPGPGGVQDSEGVRRRFDALMTAWSPRESAHHLRGLVLLARSEDIGLDYGLLAEDLAGLWSREPTARNRVRLRWARQYRGFRRGADTETTPTTEPQE